MGRNEGSLCCRKQGYKHQRRKVEAAAAQERQRNMFANGYVRPIMQRARMLHIVICQCAGETRIEPSSLCCMSVMREEMGYQERGWALV